MVPRDNIFLAILLVGDVHGAFASCVQGFQWRGQWDEVLLIYRKVRSGLLPEKGR